MRGFFAGLAVLFSFGQLYGTTTTVSNVTSLLSTVYFANNGDTILLADGTYPIVDTGSGIGLNITKSITLKSVNGASKVTITANTSYIAVQVNASNVTIDGITVATSSSFGVYVNAYSGVVLRNLVVSATGSNGQSIALNGATNSMVELCSVNNSTFHAISLGSGANYNAIINNTIQNSTTGDGVALVTSDHNIISGNTINNTYFDGVSVNGSQYNYISQNTITLPHNGVTLTHYIPNSGPIRQSIGNYIGSNTMVLSPTKSPGGSDGMWINYDSNYNMAFGNDASFASETGISIFNSVGNYILGNALHSNPLGGVYIVNTNDTSSNGSGTTPPAYNSIQQNYLYLPGANGAVTLDTAPNTDVSFNYMAGDPTQAITPTSPFGLLFRNSVTNTTVASNLIRDLAGEQIFSTDSGISLYLNRHINAGLHYTFAGAGANWDSGSMPLGGNYFSEFTTANGNPSNGSTPFSRIYQDQAGNYGLYVDHYPYQSESLGRQYLMSPVLPASGSQLAVGTLKTISWRSQACVLVDINLVGNTTQSIAVNAADYGYFRWTVPNVTPGAYTIQINCKDSGGTVRASGSTSQFDITTADLVLLSPQTNQMLDSPNSMIVSWAKSANVTLPVNVYVRYSNGGAFTLLQSGVTSDFITVAAPATSSNQVSVMISSGTYADSTDGAFTIRASTVGAFTSPAPLSSDVLFQGAAYPVEWVSPTSTAYVNISLISGGSTVSVATQLADFGKYLMLVPATSGAGSYLQLTFYSSSGAVLGTANSASFTISPQPAQPVTISASAGTPQSAAGNSVFPTLFTAIVRDANTNPVSGVMVTFSAPLTGAGGSFQNISNCNSPCITASAITNALGIATAPSFLANATAGSYNVTATSPVASGSAAFSLTNTIAQPAQAVSVTPSSGSAVSQVFTVVYSDTAGASVLNNEYFLISPTLNSASACQIQITPSGIYLYNDDSTPVLLGPAVAGGTYSNKQCVLNGTGSGVVNSGNTSTVTLSITFNSSFAGLKNVYIFAADSNGNNSGWQTRGSFTVLAQPSAVSITPASGTGSTQSFTAVYSDASGGSLLNHRFLIIGSALSTQNVCWVWADPTGIFLENDTASALMGPLTGSNTLSNSQCTLNSGTISTSGTTSTVTLSITFKAAFAGAKNLYMSATDTLGNSSTWQSFGSYNVSFTPSVPTPTSISPASGNGSTQSFTAVYSDAAGGSLLNYRFLIIGSALSTQNVCWVWTDPTGIYLENDTASALLGPLTGSNTVSNSQCTLNSGTVSTSGTTSTVTLSITFKAAFAGAKNLYMFATDTLGNSSTWQSLGSYNVSFTPSVPTPTSISPASGIGSTQTFTAVYSDAAGSSLLKYRFLIIGSTLSTQNVCWVWTDPTGIYLENDTASALTGPLTGSNTLSNSQCTLNSGTVSTSGTTSTVTLSITFKAAFAGAKNLYMSATDTLGNSSAWQSLGSYNVSFTPSVPTPTSISPASGNGSTQTFTAVYSDAAGGSLLNYRFLIIGSTLSTQNVCWVWTDPTGIYLENDTASALMGPLTGSNTLSNSQCTLNSGTVSTSGTTSTVTLSITFKAAFAGAKNLYMSGTDTLGNSSAWQSFGSYNVSFTPSVPTPTSISPASGNGSTQTFTAVYSDAAGGSLLNYRFLIIGSTLSTQNVCWVWTDPTGIYLENDTASALMGPLTGSNTLSNSQCTLNSGTVSTSGTTSTVTLSITFKAAFAGAKNLYMSATDTLGNSSTWQSLGAFTAQ